LRRLPELGLSAGARVLDAPCGAGYFALALADAGFQVVATDITDEPVPLTGLSYVRADLTRTLPWPDASFDAIFSLEGIEHLENRFQFLREIARILRPGGTLVLTTPNTAGLRSRMRFFGSGFFHQDPRPLREASPHPLHHIGLATFPELRYALHTSGLRVTRVSHTHIKPVSLIYMPLVPFMWLYTAIAFRKEREPGQRASNREIRRALFTPSLLFGENLLVVAKKPQSA
jgi:2-polyprenyl-3-methyl-5-hydroxy-6-metoxy-1,4-benzoquinol methylase